MNKKDNLIIEDVQIIFRNFSGREDTYNRAGNRNFNVVIDDEDDAQRLIDDGWNLKVLKPRDPDDATVHYLPVTVNLNEYTKVNLVSKRNITQLDEESIEILDHAEIAKVDVTLRPYDWEVNGKSGRKAYLKEMFVVLQENTLASKYNNPYDDDRSIDANDYFAPRR